MSTPITETEAAVFNPTILHAFTMRYRMPKMIARNICDTRYESVKVGANIDVDNLSRITVGTITLGTGFKTTTYQAPTETKVTIAINKWAYGAFALEIYEQSVAAKDLEALYRQSALDTVLVKVDADALALASSVTATVGADNVPLLDSQVLYASNILDGVNVPMENRHRVFHPTQYNEFLKLDKWTNSDYRGASGQINDKNVGDIYGARNWKTTQVAAGSAGHVNFECHGEALALVVRKQPSAMVLDDPDVQARKVVYPVIYGVKIMRQDHAHQLLGL